MAVLSEGTHTRKEISELTGIPRMTVYYYIKDIMEVLPVYSNQRKIARGRPPIVYWLQ